VDDDPNILQMLNFQLEKHIDTQITLLEYFTNPNESISSFNELIELNIHTLLLIVDFQMPEMNGAQLIRELKKIKPDLNCVMLSGQANTIQVNELKTNNLLHSFINKPWSEEKLLEVISPILSEFSILCKK
jgi:FixJ family two-component response regulator